MPKFERIGHPILDHNGETIETNIMLSNNSHIEIDGGNAGTHFRLKFAMEGGGWWMDRTALRELITELLYIRREVVEHFGEGVELEDEVALPPVEDDLREVVMVKEAVIEPKKMIWQFPVHDDLA